MVNVGVESWKGTEPPDTVRMRRHVSPEGRLRIVPLGKDLRGGKATNAQDCSHPERNAICEAVVQRMLLPTPDFSQYLGSVASLLEERE